MTPEEKAKSLFLWFKNMSDFGQNYEVPQEYLKNCAKKVCEETMNELVPSDFRSTEAYWAQKNYWQQVKEEIQKL